MPSLEIICLNQSEPSDFSHLPFRVDAETELVSHRRPKSLFQDDFDRLQGCIYHLTDLDSVTAYGLLKKDWFHADESIEDNVEFLDDFAPLVKHLLEQLLAASPVGQILFTTDYQFGNTDAERRGPVSFTKFWQMHSEGKVRMNTAYLITVT